MVVNRLFKSTLKQALLAFVRFTDIFLPWVLNTRVYTHLSHLEGIFTAAKMNRLECKTSALERNRLLLHTGAAQASKGLYPKEEIDLRHG